MSETPPRQRRSPLVVLLDAVLRFVTAVQTGHLPRARRKARRAVDRIGIAWLVVGVLAAAGGTAILVMAFVRTPDSLAALPPAAAAEPQNYQSSPAGSAEPDPATTAPGKPPTTAPPTTPSTRPPASLPPVEGGNLPPAVTPLTARFVETGGTAGLLVYRARVTIANRGADPRIGWQLTLTLPRPTLQIGAVTGAVARQNGSTWTFTPNDVTRTIDSGDSVDVSFEVRGATLVAARPTDCEIDGGPCDGLGS